MKTLWAIVLLLINADIGANPPNPLTLDYVLSQVKIPDIKAQQGQLTVIAERLKYTQLAADKRLNVGLFAKVGGRESFMENVADTQFYLQFKKKLFSQNTDINLLTQQQKINIEKMRLKYLLSAQKLAMMRAFFAVILADLAYDHQTQKLALSAVAETHEKEDNSIGRNSAIEILASQYQTQQDFGDRLKIENQQILSRNKLANLLQLPYPQRPDDLAYPALNNYLKYPLNDENYWHKLVYQQNPILLIFKQSITHLQAQKDLHDKIPINISAYAQAGEQNYNHDKEGHYKIGLNFNIDLNPTTDDKIAEIDNQIKQKEVELSAYTRLLDNQILALFLQLKHLKQQQKTLTIKQKYLDFYLERSSLEYQMRLTRNIGNAMVLWTFNQLEIAKTDFAIATILEEFNLLANGKIL